MVALFQLFVLFSFREIFDFESLGVFWGQGEGLETFAFN